MTTPSRADRLAALAAESPYFQGRARVLGTEDPLAAILDEIDAAMLPATLRFEADGRALTLIVSGRRLHQITEGAADDVLNRPLPVDDTALTEKAGRALESFAGGVEALRVTHDPAPADLDMSDRVSVAALAAALGLGAGDGDVPPLERFLARMGDAVTAIIHLQDRVAGEMTGAPADLAGLRIVLTTQLSAFIDARAAQCSAHSDPSLTVLAETAAPDTSIGLAVIEDQAILFSLTTSAVPKAAETFRRVI